jgi:hypothetical protein
LTERANETANGGDPLRSRQNRPIQFTAESEPIGVAVYPSSIAPRFNGLEPTAVSGADGTAAVTWTPESAYGHFLEVRRVRQMAIRCAGKPGRRRVIDSTIDSPSTMKGSDART